MYKRDKMLKEVAEKRLSAIREFTELGSGYRIAMRDLEIRGAGNLLGERQSGHMEAVGYDLYCKMLNQAVMERRAKRFRKTLRHLLTLILMLLSHLPTLKMNFRSWICISELRRYRMRMNMVRCWMS